MSTKDIENKAKRLKMLKNRQDSLQQEIDQLEEDLKNHLAAQGVEEIQAGPFRVIWKLVSSSRFDSKRFKEENGKLYKMYVTQSQYRRFSVV